jgi:hypothetical protein
LGIDLTVRYHLLYSSDLFVGRRIRQHYRRS